MKMHPNTPLYFRVFSFLEQYLCKHDEDTQHLNDFNLCCIDPGFLLSTPMIMRYDVPLI